MASFANLRAFASPRCLKSTAKARRFHFPRNRAAFLSNRSVPSQVWTKPPKQIAQARNPCRNFSIEDETFYMRGISKIPAIMWPARSGVLRHLFGGCPDRLSNAEAQGHTLNRRGIVNRYRRQRTAAVRLVRSGVQADHLVFSGPAPCAVTPGSRSACC
jgi:hypothetical protein